MEQDIRFCTAPDGVRLAYATVGQGPPLVKAAHWLSHLEFDWDSPVWRHWWTELSRHHTLIRYDARGCGLSDWNVEDFSFEAWVQDLETVVEALGLERFPLLGISQGGPGAIAYAVRHPEKVSHLILYGTFGRGRARRDPHQAEVAETLHSMMRVGWGQDNPAFRQVFTTLFVPEATTEQMRWFNDLQRLTTSPENAIRIRETSNVIDVRDLAPRVTVPTMILHARGEAGVPFEEGRQLATRIPGARLVPLEGNNHILLEDEPAWTRFLHEVRAFLPHTPPPDDQPDASSLDTQHWDQLSALFKQALLLPADQRQALLDQAYRDDPTLHRDLQSLLDADSQTGLTDAFDEALKASLSAWSAAETLQPGATVSHYEIIDKLGAGGMGVVYKARDTKLDRLVALKFLPDHLRMHDEVKERFIREAKAASALDHTNICTIYEIGETAEGRLFIAMACYAGETLKEKIGRGSLSLEEALGYAAQMTAGLSQAHEAGIVHRDVKPANVMVTDRGRVKLLDFGIAKVADVDLTKTGSTVGTTAYMSPEQARGEPVDHRTDVWSVGVVLYEMLAGQRPFRGDYEQAVIYGILNEDPAPLLTVRPETPAALAALVAKALSKDPADRYAEMTHLLRDIEALRSPATSSPPKPSPPALFSKRRWVALTAAVLLALLGGLWVVMQVRPPSSSEGHAPGARTAVAVLPFSVHASDAFGYLDVGMVDLLSTKLDGAGALRSIDPRALLGFVKREPIDDLSPEQGRRIAERFGANLFVLGNVVGVAGQLQISAALYEAGETPVLLGEATTEGEAAEIFDLVDDLAAQLLVSVRGGPGARVRRIAGVTTSSLSAYKAYLDGENAFRAGQYEAAVEAFQQAVALDSLFALAYYRLSIAAEWHGRADLARGAAELAFRQAGRLSEHDQRLLEGFLLWRRGVYAEAEQIYRSVVATYPDDVEAWVQLAEVLFHTNPFRGRSSTESRQPYERVLSYEPDDVGVLLHLARVAAAEGHPDELDRLVSRILVLSPSGDRTLEMNALQAFVHANRVEEARVEAMAEQASEMPLAIAAWDVVVFSKNPERAEPLVRRLTASWRPPEVRATAHAWLAHLYLMKGRWRAAHEELSALETLDPVAALEYRALFAVLPFAPVNREERLALREALARVDTAAVRQTDNPSFFFNVHNEVHPILLPYLTGLLNVQGGDTLGALQRAAALDRLNAHPRTGTLAPDLALSIRSELHHRQGRTAEALAALEQTRLEIWYHLTMASPFYAEAYERFRRAELLFELGRYREAIGWYSVIGEVCPAELAYVPVSQMRLGEIYDRLGEVEHAVAHYARFVDLWTDADPELRPMVDQAQARLDALRE